jgi:ornithine carbamoyltransferase
MGQERDAARRRVAFAGHLVSDVLWALAASNALFMRCLPAHRGEEVTDSALDGRQSVVIERPRTACTCRRH